MYRTDISKHMTMIRRNLIEKNLKLRILASVFKINNNSPEIEWSARPRKFKLKSQHPDLLRVCRDDGDDADLLCTSMAYFLPWKEDTGYYINIPRSRSEVYLFITAELTGCCVGVQCLDDQKIRIRHWNRDPDFQSDEFKAYTGNETISQKIFWLIPSRYESTMGTVDNDKVKISYYEHQGPSNPTCFWGEFTNNQWHFYYQEHMKGNAINEFLYII